MKTVEDSSLIPGEEIVRKMRPHWIVLVVPGIVLAVATTAYIWLLTSVHTWNVETASTIGNWVLTIAYAYVMIRWSLLGIIRWATTTYLFTDQRIITRTGLLRIEGESIALNKIHSIQFSKTLLERLLGSGSLTIETAAENQVHIRNVISAEEVQRELYERIVSHQEPETTSRPAVE
jgi:uncharacterized membrane protein YdbT with pleckstrin-like domain